jgi:hypothetical protein
MGDADTLLSNLEQFLPYLKPLFDIARHLAKPEVRAALAEGFKEFERRIQEEEQAFLDFIVRHGWIGLEHYVTSEQVRLFIKAESDSGPDAADKLVCACFLPESIETMISGWQQIPYFQTRKQVCDDVIRAYRMGIHSLVVPALLPLAEGICAEVDGIDPGSTRTVQDAAKKVRFSSEIDEDFGTAMIDVIEKSYYRKSDFRVQESGFNRHRILHGRSADYATPANSLRAILLVQTVIRIYQSIVEQADQTRRNGLGNEPLNSSPSIP